MSWLETKPLARAIRQYMQMVLHMLTYIRDVRTGDRKLHLEATEVFVKYFFALDTLNYARLTPVCRRTPAVWLYQR